MKRKRLTRKKKAFRWLFAAVLLGALAWVLLPWALTPEAANRQTLRQRLTGETEVVYQLESPEGRSLLLSLNDHVVAMGAYGKQSWYRWDCQRLDIVEREPERPFAAGYIDEFVYNREPEETINYFYVFGVVQDEAVAEIGIVFDAIDGGHDQAVHLEEQDWLTTPGGERVFLWALEPEVSNQSRACTVTGYHADGTATESLQIMGLPKWQ